MTLQPIPDGTEYLAEIAVKMEAALGELHHYYRFGRHLKDVQQKPYLILSHCGLLLSSLLMTERQVPSGIIEENATLAKLFDKLDIENLGHCDYKWWTLHANDYETYLADGPKWFKLWADVLEHLGTTRASDIGNFSECLLKCFAGDDRPDKKLTKKKQDALAELLGSPQAGRLFLHSTRILEDLIASLGDFLAQLDPAVHAHEQVQSLACLLSQVRRTIVFESEVRGPYAMPDNVGWESSSVRLRALRGKTLGLLTVAATDESGELTCTYTLESDAKKKERSWSRAFSALPCGYEEMLFKTWCYETDDHHPIIDLFGQAGARWVVRSLEADQLDTICPHVDTLLDRLGTHRECDTASEHLARVARNDQSRWTPTELPWTFVRNLDKAIGKLRFACREAAALGGNNPMAEVISNLWPSQSLKPHAGGADTSQGPPPECEMSREETLTPSNTHSPMREPHSLRITTREVPATRQETAADSETPSRAAISTGLPASLNQDHVPEDQKTDADHDTANDHAMISDREDSVPQATSFPTESSESVIGQTPGDGMVADHGEATDDPGQVTSSSTPASQQETSLQDQNQPPSSQADQRRRLARRRGEKLATTMNILLGESVDGKETGARSNP